MSDFCAATVIVGEPWDHHTVSTEEEARSDVDYHVGQHQAAGFVVRRLQYVLDHPDGRVAIVEMESQ